MFLVAGLAPQALHAPDGFFSLPVVVVGYAVSAAIIGYSVYRTNQQLNERMVPLMGVMAAFIFAAQMLNFPVAGGTSGHLIGGALAAILLGPWAAVLVMTAVVAVQALVFQDGGLVVLGINLLNMSILSCLAGYAVYRGLGMLGSKPSGLLARGFAAAWVSVEIAAVAAAIQLALSGTSPLSVALPAMVGVHALIGIGEGLITVGALSFIRASRPDLLEVSAVRRLTRGVRA
jgi:cobalt/nickel transport system permease protein